MADPCSMDTQETLFLPEPPPGAVYNDVAGVCRPAEDPLESLPPPAENPTSFAPGDPACSTHMISRNHHFTQPGVTRDYCLPHDPARDLCLDPSYQTNDRDGLLQSASCDPTQREEGQLYVQHVLKKDPERVAVAVNEINQNPPPEGVEAVRQAVQVALQEVGSEGNAGKAAVTTFAQTVSDPELRRLAVATAMGTTPPTREGTLDPRAESLKEALPGAAGTSWELAGCGDSGRTAPIGAVWNREGPQPDGSMEVAAGGTADEKDPARGSSSKDSSPGLTLSISGVIPVDTSNAVPIQDRLANLPGPGAEVVLRSLVQEPSENEGKKSDRAGELGIDARRNPTRRGETDFAARIERAGTGSEGLSRHPAPTKVTSFEVPAGGAVEISLVGESTDTAESPTFTPSQGLQPRGNEIDGAPVGTAMASGGEPDPYAVAFAPVPPSLFTTQPQGDQRGSLPGDGRRGGTSDNRAPQIVADKGHSSDHHDGTGDPDGRRRNRGNGGERDNHGQEDSPPSEEEWNLADADGASDDLTIPS